MLKIYKNDKFKIECPSCGHKNEVLAQGLKNGPNLLLCYPEDGGCDRYFFARVYPTALVSEIMPVGPSQFNTCKNCIHWDELRDRHNGTLGNCTGPRHHLADSNEQEARPEVMLITQLSHSCNGWEPR